MAAYVELAGKQVYYDMIIFLLYLKSLNVLLNLDLLNTYLHNLLNPHQSAYIKHHSTETVLLYIHDHLINAIGSQKVSCLCLLDLSAAFDTIDHNIFLLVCHLGSAFRAPL